jgi:hypothetical protein
LNTYKGVEIRKLPDGPVSKSYTRGVGFSGVCSGSKSARRSNTLGDHINSKKTSSINYKKVKISDKKKLVPLTRWDSRR